MSKTFSPSSEILSDILQAVTSQDGYRPNMMAHILVKPANYEIDDDEILFSCKRPFNQNYNFPYSELSGHYDPKLHNSELIFQPPFTDGFHNFWAKTSINNNYSLVAQNASKIEGELCLMIDEYNISHVEMKKLAFMLDMLQKTSAYDSSSFNDNFVADYKERLKNHIELYENEDEKDVVMDMAKNALKTVNQQIDKNEPIARIPLFAAIELVNMVEEDMKPKQTTQTGMIP